MIFDSDLTACAQLVERADPDRFLATMAAPPDARRVLFPLYAMNVEVSRAPWVTEEATIAEMRLQWWRDVADEIGRGGPVRRHEVATPLAYVLTRDLAPVLDELVAVRRWDIYRDPFEDEAHLDAYLTASSGGLMWLAAQALGAKDEAPIRDVGYAAGVAAWFRAVPELETRKRVPLLDGTSKGVRRLAEGALDRLADARRNRAAIPIFARSALLGGWQAETMLRQAAKDPSRVGEGRLGQSGTRKRLSLMWQSATGRF